MTEWKTYKLSDIANVQTGPFGSQLHNKDYVVSGTPIVTVEHLGERFFLTQNLPCVSTEDKKRLIKYTLIEGDIVFSRVGSVDRCSFVSKFEEGWLFSGRCLRVRSNTHIVNPLYLYYYFCLSNIKQYVKSIAVGATMPSINTKLLNEIPISLPPLAEQKRIADILSAIDDKIELNRRINANLEQQAQALYKSWFVDFEPFGGKMPEDWKEDIASNYYDITIGKTPPRKETQWFSKSQKDRVWISISDMGKNGMFLGHSTEYITQSAIDKFNIVIVPDKTVLLSFKLTVGRVVISEGEVTTNEAIAHFKTKDKNLLEYTYLTLKNYEFASLGSTSSIATAVNSKTIKSMPWIMPNYDLVKQFHMQTEPLFNIIQKNEKENNNLSTLRETLLPKLMSGEIKV